MVKTFNKSTSTDTASTALDTFLATVIAFKPKSASRPQIAMLKAKLETLGQHLNGVEAELRFSLARTRELKKTHQRFLKAAQILEANLQDEIGPAHVNGTAVSLLKLVNTMALIQSEIERAEREDRETDEWSRAVRCAFEELTVKIEAAQIPNASAQSNRNAVIRHKERRAGDNDGTAGLVKAIGSLSTALDAMTRSTTCSDADTFKAKSDLSRFDGVHDDPNIALALTAVRNAETPDHSSPTDRLAILNGRVTSHAAPPGAEL